MAKPKAPPADPKPPKPKVYTADQAWLIKKLRLISVEWPAKERCLNAARVGPGKYQCAECKELFKERYLLKADHVNPVVDPVEGFVGIPTYVTRLFTEEPSDWQALCEVCHAAKTKAENAIRNAESKKRLAQPK